MLLRKFSWLYRCANWRYRDFFAAENIKDIKFFRTKKFGFNISGNYSGGFLIANCAGKKCTARCSCEYGVCTHCQGYGVTWKYRTLQQGAVHFSPRPYAQYRWATRLQARCGTLPCNHLSSYYKGRLNKLVSMEGRVSILLGCIHASRAVSFCFSFSHVARYAPLWKNKILRHNGREYIAS